jgi:hypothetical protein
MGGAYCPGWFGRAWFAEGGVFCLVLGEMFLRGLVGFVWQENLFFVGG